MIGRLIAGVAVAASFGTWALVMLLEHKPGLSIWSGGTAIVGAAIAVDAWRERRDWDRE